MNLLIPNKNFKRNNYFFQEFDNFFDGISDQYKLDGDVQESEKYILLSIDLPGLKEEDINIEVKESFLEISGERKKELSNELKSRYSGRNYGPFKKTYKLSENLNIDEIEADYSQGVLKLLLPKKEEIKPKKIDVQFKKGSLLSQIFKNKESA